MPVGLNSEHASRLVFDIETVPLPDAADYLEVPEAPSNYRDPVKIEAYIAEKQQEAVLRAGLDVDLCQIVAIGWCLEGEPVQSMTLAQFGGDEGLMIRSFWQIARDRHLVGYNCLGFDLP